jgi:hypothetical protein
MNYNPPSELVEKFNPGNFIPGLVSNYTPIDDIKSLNMPADFNKYLRIAGNGVVTATAQLNSAQTLQVCNSIPTDGRYIFNSVYNAVQYANTIATQLANVQILITETMYETKSVTLNSYVSITSQNYNNAFSPSIILVAEVGSYWIRLKGLASISRCTIVANNLCDYAIDVSQSNAGEISAQETAAVYNARIAGLRVANNSVCFLILSAFSNTAALSAGALVQSGGFLILVSSAFLNIPYGIKLDGGLCWCTGLICQSCSSDAIKLENSSFISISGGIMLYNTNCLNIATSSQIDIMAYSFLKGTNTAILTADATARVNISSVLSYENSAQFTLPTNRQYINLCFTESDIDRGIGLKTFSNNIVGDKNFPSGAYFGNGFLNRMGVSILKNAGGFVDVSSALSLSSQTITSLIGRIVGNAIYIGDSASKFYILDVNITAALVSGTGVLQPQYWDGATWTNFNTMSMQTASPYRTYANSLFSAVEAQQIYFDARLSTTAYNWSITSVNGISGYWMRFIITIANITTAPSISFLNLLYNSKKITSTGFELLYGGARVFKSLAYDTANIWATGASAPGNQDLYFSNNLQVQKQNNSFSNAGTKNFGLCIFLPSDFDSSSPLRLKFAFSSASNAAAQGAFLLSISVTAATTTNLVYTVNPGAGVPTDQIISSSLTPNQTDGTRLAFGSVDIPLPTIISRDASGNNNFLLCLNILRLVGANGNVMNLSNVAINYLSFSSGAIFI